jgi:acyl carrier protein
MVEKTGYPRDMLDLDLDLEADLGVDTVKQAEMFSAIREIYNIPRDENRKLRDYPTLAHVIRFVYDKRPDLTSAAPASDAEKKEIKPVAPETRAIPAPTPESVKERILTLMVEKTGYPRDMLDLDLDLEADLGVDTVKQAEMFSAIREIYNIPRDENRKLRDYPTLAHVIRFVYDKRPDLAGTVTTPNATRVKEGVEVIPAPVARPTNDVDEVKERILTLMVEKTGYPRDMLDLDLDLEADLGVDTVKQAEMFSAIREIYNIPRDENRKLRDYPTLAHVIRFVYEKRPDLAGTAQPSLPSVLQASVPAPTPIVAHTLTEDLIKERVLDIVAEKTGYPKDMLDLDLDLEADLGVDTVKQAEMFASVRATYNIPRDENLKLRNFPTLAHVIRFAVERAGDTATKSPVPEKAPIAPSRPVLATFEAANRIPRRAPTPILRPPLDLCKPTGVTLGPGSRVVVMPD